MGHLFVFDSKDSQLKKKLTVNKLGIYSINALNERFLLLGQHEGNLEILDTYSLEVHSNVFGNRELDCGTIFKVKKRLKESRDSGST